MPQWHLGESTALYWVGKWAACTGTPDDTWHGFPMCSACTGIHMYACMLYAHLSCTYMYM